MTLCLCFVLGVDILQCVSAHPPDTPPPPPQLSTVKGNDEYKSESDFVQDLSSVAPVIFSFNHTHLFKFHRVDLIYMYVACADTNTCALVC